MGFGVKGFASGHLILSKGVASGHFIPLPVDWAEVQDVMSATSAFSELELDDSESLLLANKSLLFECRLVIGMEFSGPLPFVAKLVIEMDFRTDAFTC